MEKWNVYLSEFYKRTTFTIEGVDVIRITKDFLVNISVNYNVLYQRRH